MITYNNVLIQYRYRCISITYMIKILGHRKERYDIEFRVVQNCDVVSNKALISDGRSENFVLINTINWLYYIYIYSPLFLYFFLRIDSKRECSRQIEPIQAYYDIFRTSFFVRSEQTIRKRQWSKKYPNIWKISRLDAI